MGIDLYLHWHGMTEAERATQVTGFSIEAGHLGYLREAYHGAPYATPVLVPEAFQLEEEAGHPDGIPVSSSVLRERLPRVIETAIEREAHVYGHDRRHSETRTVVKSFEDFVALCEAKEADTGEPCRMVASY